ncbi:MAG: PAS domain S-box protein, partial [Methanococcaceae archaeon]
MIINIAGENVLNTVSPVNDEAYHQMLRDTVGFSESLTEMTFGAIPEFLNNSIKTLTGIEYFYGLSYVIAGQLFGTSVLAFKSGQATPSRDLLESFAHLAAVALRRKKAEEAMRQSEEKFRSIVELSSTAMHFYNLEVNDRLVFIGSNPSADRITGISHQSLIGLSIEEAFPALTDTDIPEIYKKVAKGEISHQAFETPYQDSRFSGFYDVHIFQLRYGYVAVNFFDITDRKRAEAALRESENNFKQLIDNMGEGIGIVDKNEQFLFANQAAESIFCTAPGLLAGRSLCEFVAPDNIDIITSQTLVRQTGIKSVYESRLILHTGEKKTILITATPRFDNEGIFIGTFGIFRDITERKEAELLLKKNAAELKELNSTKDKLFSILAHDLRGPLGGFMNLTETIFTNLDELTKREITEYSSAMHVTSKKVFSLLTNLLEWSKLQTGKMEEKPVRFNLFSAVESTQNLFASSASVKSINIINEVCHNGYVFADKNLVSVILRNLISNAIKFTGRGGNIIISCCTVPDFIEISVADSGIGMSGDALQKIFRIDSGFRTEGTDGEEGSGLGLVICRELIEKCGGKIRVNSVLTKGTTFTFTLPIHQNGGDVTI